MFNGEGQHRNKSQENGHGQDGFGECVGVQISTTMEPKRAGSVIMDRKWTINLQFTTCGGRIFFKKEILKKNFPEFLSVIFFFVTEEEEEEEMYQRFINRIRSPTWRQLVAALPWIKTFCPPNGAGLFTRPWNISGLFRGKAALMN